METQTSQQLFDRALQVIPGGVNSPVRAFGSVGGTPRFLVTGEGAYVTDEDGNRYVDLVQSWGPLPLGHARPEILAAARGALQRGSTFGAPTRGEVGLAELIAEAVPSIQKVRLTSSGTEAAMSAVRLARGATGRSTHRQVRRSLPRSQRRPARRRGLGRRDARHPRLARRHRGRGRDTVVVPWNDRDALVAAVDAHGDASPPSCASRWPRT